MCKCVGYFYIFMVQKRATVSQRPPLQNFLRTLL
nr:MAG TPA: RAS ASSOCIATION DOMAIN-CONTAINING PROTEIN 5, TUMOR SUPPRESSOR, COILED-COIL, RAS.69A [Caudoviricetes sp.]